MAAPGGGDGAFDAVDGGDVGFHVEDGRAVEGVEIVHLDDARFGVDADDSGVGDGDGVGASRRARCEDAQFTGAVFVGLVFHEAAAVRRVVAGVGPPQDLDVAAAVQAFQPGGVTGVDDNSEAAFPAFDFPDGDEFHSFHGESPVFLSLGKHSTKCFEYFNPRFRERRRRAGGMENFAAKGAKETKGRKEKKKDPLGNGGGEEDRDLKDSRDFIVPLTENQMFRIGKEVVQAASARGAALSPGFRRVRIDHGRTHKGLRPSPEGAADSSRGWSEAKPPARRHPDFQARKGRQRRCPLADFGRN